VTARPRPLAIAHRAGNELSTLRAAEQAGADLVEADVWFYRGRLEVRHLKTMGPIPLLWDRWKLAPASTPRLLLPQLLEAAGPAVQLMFDLKGTDGRLPGALLDATSAHLPGRPFTVCSQSWELLEALHDLPLVRVAHSVGSRRQLARLPARLPSPGQHMISIHFKLLSDAVVASLRERAGTIITWPINTRERFEQVANWGVDGFTTDNLELLRQVCAASRG
jgi:glycerophosphoryl diester phosphodiesterase